MTRFRRLVSFPRSLSTPCTDSEQGDRSRGDVEQYGIRFLNRGTTLVLMMLLLFAMGCIVNTSDDDDDGGNDSEISCTSDSDCQSDEMCVDSECVAGSTACSDDTDCDAGQTCVDDVCIEDEPECTDDVECAEGEICVDGLCTLECDPACEPGEVCIEGVCFEDTPECSTDVDCDSGTGETCVDNVCTTQTTPSFTLSTGTFAITGLENLEGMANLGNLPYANFTGEGPAVAFSGFNDTAVLNLVTREVLLDLSNSGIERFGVAGISLDPPGQNSTAAILSYGPATTFGGFLVQYFPSDGQFSPFGQLLTGSTGFDAIPFGGDVVSSGMTYTALNGVNFIAFNSTSEQFGPTNELLVPGDFSGASGIPLSAYVDTPGGPALVLFGNPGFDLAGEVWFHDRSTPPLAPVFIVQNDPRKLRCVPPICAVSNFASDSLSIFTWDGITPPAAPTTVSTCDGPLGIDITQLDNGNFAIVTACFNDSMVNETVVQSSAAEVSNTQTPVDSACLNPGHALWMLDSEGLKILISCFGSSNYGIMSSNQ